jgi:hypothetical protein
MRNINILSSYINKEIKLSEDKINILHLLMNQETILNYIFHQNNVIQGK